MTCEDEVSEALYGFLLTATLDVLHWHPPGGKKYFTPHLRIPLLKAKVRRGRNLIDLIASDTDFIFLVECKCHLSESKGDIRKLREIRDDIGLPGLKKYFVNQGVPQVRNARYLILGLGVRFADRPKPEDFVVLTP